MRSVTAVWLALLVCPAAISAAQGSPPAAGHQHEQPGSKRPAPASGTGENHSQHAPPATASELPAHIPPLTDADRAAAFPEVEGHTVHDEGVNYFVLFDRFEWTVGSGVKGFDLDSKGWIGGDRNRVWFRAEGAAEGRALGEGQAHVLYGRAIGRWFDVVAGARQDVRSSPARTWAAIGLQGLAPYWFETELTAYLGASGRTHLRLEADYQLLLTNRLVLQPLVELEIHGKPDPERGIGAGLSTADAGLRLRYEFRRELAPYVGISWSRRFFGTADLARAAGEQIGSSRLALGLRMWL